MATKEQKIEEATEALGLNEELSAEEDFDFVEGFLKAAEMVDDNIQPIVIKRNGITLMRFSIHAITAPDMRRAQKKATVYMPNPRNKKLPPIEKDRDQTVYESYIIYLATVESDRKKLWDNPEFKQKFNVMEGYELIDKVLLPGEKDAIIDAINDLSGYGENSIGDNDTIEIAKNS